MSDSSARDPLVLPAVDPKDVEQEAWIYRLLGKRVSRAILRKRMERSQAYLFSDYLPNEAIPLTTSDPIPAYETVEQLVDWAIERGGDIQDQILGFLDDPTDGGLEALMDSLADSGVELHELVPNGGSFADVVRRYMDSVGEATLDDLYLLARNTHMTERPEATIRQLIRRLIKRGELKRREDGTITLA